MNKKYLNLLNIGGKGPFRFLVLGGFTPGLYNDMFYPTSNFGSGQDLKLLIVKLVDKHLTFDAIIIFMNML